MTVFNNYSLGLATGRDAWCYSAFRDQLIDNATTMIGTYEAARNTFHTEASQTTPQNGPANRSSTRSSTNNHNSPAATKSAGTATPNKTSPPTEATNSTKTPSPHRSTALLQTTLLLPPRHEREALPTPHNVPHPNHANTGFYILGLGASKPFSVFMMSVMPDLNFYGSEGGQFFRVGPI